MHHIGKHISGAVRPKKEKATERGELMRYFMDKLNMARRRDGLGALTMGRMGRLLVAIPTKDLYYLKSVCDDSDKRGGIDSFSKKFWWEVKPRKEGEEQRAPKKFKKK